MDWCSHFLFSLPLPICLFIYHVISIVSHGLKWTSIRLNITVLITVLITVQVEAILTVNRICCNHVRIGRSRSWSWWIDFPQRRGQRMFSEWTFPRGNQRLYCRGVYPYPLWDNILNWNHFYIVFMVLIISSLFFSCILQQHNRLSINSQQQYFWHRRMKRCTAIEACVMPVSKIGSNL